MDITSFVSILIGGGILGFIQFLISRHDSKHDKTKDILERINALDKKVDKMEASLDERDAVLARTHILRFADDIYNNGTASHSKEYYEQTLDDAETYRRYCAQNPSFANGRTQAAVERIKTEYDKLMQEHKL